MHLDPSRDCGVSEAAARWGWADAKRRLHAELEQSSATERSVALALALGWHAVARGDLQVAEQCLERAAQSQELASWALAGQAWAAMRAKNYGRASELLAAAQPHANASDVTLAATLRHLQGTVCFHLGDLDSAQEHLLEALRIAGADHALSPRILDTLGMLHAGRDQFHDALEFYRHSLEAKVRLGDRLGQSLTHGQIGRLLLDWGDPAGAADHFRINLELATQAGDALAVALMQEHIGRSCLELGRPDEAAGWIDTAIASAVKGGWTIAEAFARKDRALVHLALDELDDADHQAQRAQELFDASEFPEGLAHVRVVSALVDRRRGAYEESAERLSAALAHFERTGERGEAARVRLEIARTLSARGAPRPLVVEALRAALDEAERSRRDNLVARAELLLERHDEASLWRRAAARTRGRGVRWPTTSLLDGTREAASVLFLDLRGSTDYTRAHDPKAVFTALNRMMAEFSGVLERRGATVTAYLGDGFMAVLREAHHAQRAVMAGLELNESLERFNRPRRILGLPLFAARIGISTGEVCLGNIGTYDKMDYTAIGATVNLAARLQYWADTAGPCISSSTYEQVRDHFLFSPQSPRRVSPKGLPECDVWDVVGCRD